MKVTICLSYKVMKLYEPRCRYCDAHTQQNKKKIRGAGTYNFLPYVQVFIFQCTHLYQLFSYRFTAATNCERLSRANIKWWWQSFDLLLHVINFDMNHEIFNVTQVPSHCSGVHRNQHQINYDCSHGLHPCLHWFDRHQLLFFAYAHKAAMWRGP